MCAIFYYVLYHYEDSLTLDQMHFRNSGIPDFRNSEGPENLVSGNPQIKLLGLSGTNGKLLTVLTAQSSRVVLSFAAFVKASCGVGDYLFSQT